MTTRHITIKGIQKQAEADEFWYRSDDVQTSGIANLDNRCLAAYKAYQSMPMPAAADESWRNFDLSRIPLKDIHQAWKDGSLASPKLAIHMEENKPLPKGVWKLQEAIREAPEIVGTAFQSIPEVWQDKYEALVMAFASQGAFLSIDPDTDQVDPIWVGKQHDSFSLGLWKHLIRVGRGSKATVILGNPAFEDKPTGSLDLENLYVQVGEGAHLTLIEIDSGSAGNGSIQHEHAYLERNAKLDWVICTTDSEYIKKYVRVDLHQAGASANLSALYLSGGEQQFEFDTYQDHQAESTTSDLLFKGVLLGGSRTVFRGMIHVAPAAIKTDGYQSNRNLVLSHEAHADSIPGLEILADDVRCTHGATVGKIDPEQLFYLQSRGIGDLAARRLIVNGFFEPILQRIPVETLRECIQERIDQAMSTR